MYIYININIYFVFILSGKIINITLNIKHIYKIYPVNDAIYYYLHVHSKLLSLGLIFKYESDSEEDVFILIPRAVICREFVSTALLHSLLLLWLLYCQNL
jgi:hypothetical protein